MTTFKIFKYPLEMAEFQSVKVEGAVKLLSIAKQEDDAAVMYVLVDPEREEYKKTSVFEVKTIGTGNPITSNGHGDFDSFEFINTLSFLDDALMFHFFARRRFLE